MSKKKKIIIIIVTIALLLSIPGTLLVWGLALPAQYGGAFQPELSADVQGRLARHRVL